MEPGVYSWIQESPLEWEPEDTPSGLVRVEFSKQRGEGTALTYNLAYTDGATNLRRYWGESGPDYTIRWARSSTATPPQEYSLPLTEGFTPITPCTYWRNQFSEVFVGGSTGGTITDGTVIATLPEGFRPKQTVERPATFAVSGSQAAGSVTIMPDGNISVHGQTSATGVVFSMDFVVAN